MNKEDIKSLRNKKEKLEESKVLEAIHNNHRIANMNYQMDKQLNEIAMKEQTRKQAKKEKRKERLFVIGLIGLLVGSIFVLKVSSENFMKDCLAAGNSQYTCERAN